MKGMRGDTTGPVLALHRGCAGGAMERGAGHLDKPSPFRCDLEGMED